jgi:hypothetical protein
MIMKGDLVNMKRVMRRLELCDKNEITSLKGKVAAHISAADELLVSYSFTNFELDNRITFQWSVPRLGPFIDRCSMLLLGIHGFKR